MSVKVLQDRRLWEQREEQRHRTRSWSASVCILCNLGSRQTRHESTQLHWCFRRKGKNLVPVTATRLLKNF